MDFVDIELNEKKIRVYRNGNVHLSRVGQYSHLFTEKPNGWKAYYNDVKSYYILILVNYKMYKVHRIVAMAFLGLDITNPKIQVDHIDHNTENNSVENLRVCSSAENNQNRKNIKGYYFCKKTNKYKVKIILNGKPTHGGYYVNEEDAKKRYLEMKQEQHEYYRLNVLGENLI